MHSLRSLSRMLPAIAVLAGLTTGCSMLMGGGSGAPNAAAPATAVVEADRAAGESAADTVDDTGADTGADSTGTAETTGDAASASTKTVAKATFPAPFAKGATVDVAVHGLKRRGQLLDLTFSLTPHAPEGSDAREKLSPYRILGESSFNVTLIDTVNVKRHVVVKDSEGKTLKPDDVFTTILLEQQGFLTYTFAAPPADVTRMDVHIADWPPFHDVPVE